MSYVKAPCNLALATLNQSLVLTMTYLLEDLVRNTIDRSGAHYRYLLLHMFF